MQPYRYGYTLKIEFKYMMDGLSGHHVKYAKGSCCMHYIRIGHVVPVMLFLDQRSHIHYQDPLHVV